MIGNFRKRGSLRNSLVAVNPSISGICRSMNTTSNRRGLVPCSQDLHGFTAMVGHGYDCSGALQQFRRNLLVHLVVFHQQDPDSRGIMHGAASLPRTGTVIRQLRATPNRSTRVS